MSYSEKLTVKYLKRFLADCDPNMEIAFGASKYRKRPLVFYRFHYNDTDMLLVELNELDSNSENISECECRITVSEFLEGLRAFDDDVIVFFGSSLDASPLEFSDIQKAVAINLIQPEEPK